MRKISIRLPIAAKAVLLIAALGVMSAAADWLTLRSLHEIDRVNEIITQQVEPARLALTEAKIAVGWMGLATYKMAGTNDVDTEHEANDERAGQYAAAKAALANAAAYLPDRREDFDGMLRRLDLVAAIANSVHDLMKAGFREQARWTLEFKFDPALVDATTSMNRLIDILGGQNKMTMQAAAAQKAHTYNILLIVLIGGTLATVVIAMFLAHRTVAGPLQRLAGVMRQIAQGQFDAPVEGLRRGDEVGAMARAVLVFRDNGLALREAQAQRQREREQAAGDKRAALDRLASSFESKVLSVAADLAFSAAQLDGSARSMNEAAEESGRSARDATVVAEETTEVAGTVSSAIDELPMAMHDIDQQLANASGVVVEATRRADVAVANANGLLSTVSEIDKVAGHDPRHRQPDQSACAQRHHRGGARRRIRARLRRGGAGGQDAGRADHAGARQHQGQDRRGCRHHRRRARRHAVDVHRHRQYRTGLVGHHRLGARAERGDAEDRRERRWRRRPHAPGGLDRHRGE